MIQLPLAKSMTCVALALALTAAIALTLDDYAVYVVTIGAIFATLALAFDVLLGFTGYLSLAHGALYGFGAYAGAILTARYGLSFWVALPLCGLLTGIVGACIALLAFRTRGLYFAVLTLGIGLIGHQMFLVLSDLTGGIGGFIGIPAPEQPDWLPVRETTYHALLALGLLFIAWVCALWFVRSRLGAECLAVREDITLAQALGIRVASARLAAFTFSAVFAGLAGALFAAISAFIAPESFTVLGVGFELVALAVVGGMGTLWGPVLGAALLTALPEALRITATLSLLAAIRTVCAARSGRLDSAHPAKDGQTGACGMSLLQVRNIQARFGGVVALAGVSLDVPEGSIFGLIGPNGAGKTTLINLVSGLIAPSAGHIVFDGRRGPWSIAQTVRHGIVRTFQQTRAFLGLSVRENLRIAAVHSPDPGCIEELIQTCNLGDVLDRTARDLPYATLRHLGIALALALKPRLLLLDEPAVGLTADEVARLGALVQRWNAVGITVLLVEHNVHFLMEISQRVAVLDRGLLLFEGSPQECQAEQKVIDVYLGRRPTDADD